MATLIIKTNEETLEFDTAIGFDPADLPYLCSMGYRMNCSSTASTSALDSYWDLVDDLFNSRGINTAEYVTLLSIITEEGRFGV